MSRKLALSERAKSMRKMPTEPEKRLWRRLSNSQLGGYKFRRQAVIAAYIVDFLCAAKALILEVDGDTHNAELDRTRDGVLARAGYRTIRFSNRDVMTNMKGVLTTILSAVASCADRWTHPNPSPEGEGLDLAP